MPTTPTGRFWIESSVRALVTELGVSPSSVARRAGLESGLFDKLPTSLDPVDYYSLWAALEAETDDDTMALRVIERGNVHRLSAPVIAAMCSNDLESAARRIADYKPLIGPLQLDVSTSSSGLRIVAVWPQPPTPSPGLVIAELLTWVSLARHATGHRVVPTALRLPVLPSRSEDYHAYVGIALRQGPLPVVEFSIADAHRPFVDRDERLWRAFEPELRKRLIDLDSTTTTVQRLRTVLAPLLASGDASLVTAAAELAVSSRTLHRRLATEGTTFQQQLDEVRERLARHYLDHSEFTTAEIAFLLGYGSVGSFHRAFRAWTGTTPGDHRTAARVRSVVTS